MAKLDGYTLAEKIRKARRIYPITATEQALYHELVAICNDVEWRDIFPVSNAQLCSALDINEKTLIRARNTLIQQELIFYKSGKSRRAVGTYSFKKAIGGEKKKVNEMAVTSTVNNTVVNPTTGEMAVGSAVTSTGEMAVTSTVNNTDLIETKLKQNKSIVTASPPPPLEKDAEPFWKELVATWFEFNKQKFGDDPSFVRDEPKILKRIIHRLKKRAEDKNVEWKEAAAVDRFKNFLDKCYADQWLSTNFLLSNLEKQFDKIILNHNGNKHQGTAGKTISTGRAIVRDQL